MMHVFYERAFFIQHDFEKIFSRIALIIWKLFSYTIILHPERWQSGRMRRS